MSNLDERRAELREHYAKVRATLLAAIDGLSDAEMVEETIDGWSVKDHLVHLTVWDEIRRQEIERISAGGHFAWPMMKDDLVDQFNDMTVKLRRHLSLEQVRNEFVSSRAAVIAAIDAATERGLEGGLYGEAGLQSTHDIPHADFIRKWRTNR